MRILFIASYVQETLRRNSFTDKTHKYQSWWFCLHFFMFSLLNISNQDFPFSTLSRGVHPALNVQKTFFFFSSQEHPRQLNTVRKLRLNKVKVARGKANTPPPKRSRTCSGCPFALHQWKIGNLSPKVATWARAVVKKNTSWKSVLFLKNVWLLQQELSSWHKLLFEADHHTSLHIQIWSTTSSILPVFFLFDAQPFLFPSHTTHFNPDSSICHAYSVFFLLCHFHQRFTSSQIILSLLIFVYEGSNRWVMVF